LGLHQSNINKKEEAKTTDLYLADVVPCVEGVRFVVFNATFNNILVISWRSVLLVEETGVPGEYHRPVASH
jgi:hypothetical protein